MQLKTKLSVQKVRIIADYNRKENNEMFTAILKSAFENKAMITVADAQNWFSGAALNLKMWENILNRLTVQGYFQTSTRNRNRNIYHLTEFGKMAAQQETFFKSLKGELEIWVLKEPVSWFPSNVIKIKEINNGEGKGEQETESSRKFKLPQEVILLLKNGSYQLKSIDEQCRVLEEDSKVELVVQVAAEGSIARIEDLEFPISLNGVAASRDSLIDNFLSQQYNGAYRNKQVFVPFDPKNLHFKRQETIKKPFIGKVSFDTIEKQEVNFMAKSEQDAQAWRLALLRNALTDYIFQTSDFEKLDYETRQKFKPHYQLNPLSMEGFKSYLEENKKTNFYQLMKIQALQFLSF